MKMTENQFQQIKEQIVRLASQEGSFYHKKFEGIDVSTIQTQSDFEKLPFTNKSDLREAYPLGLQAVRRSLSRIPGRMCRIGP